MTIIVLKKLSNTVMICIYPYIISYLQTNVGGDYTGEYDYTTVDGSQPETPTDTAGQGQVTLQRVHFSFFILWTSSAIKCIRRYLMWISNQDNLQCDNLDFKDICKIIR